MFGDILDIVFGHYDHHKKKRSILHYPPLHSTNSHI
jgi:hypothetical protein